jgi:hypothetical protein
MKALRYTGILRSGTFKIVCFGYCRTLLASVGKAVQVVGSWSRIAALLLHLKNNLLTNDYAQRGTS